VRQAILKMILQLIALYILYKVEHKKADHFIYYTHTENFYNISTMAKWLLHCNYGCYM